MMKLQACLLGQWIALPLIFMLTACGNHKGNNEENMPAPEPNQATLRFHEIVKTGSIEELRKALADGAEVNAPGHTEQTALMVAIAAKDSTKLKHLLEHGADPELTDQFNATPLGHAVDWDFAEGVSLLLKLGVDRGYEPKYPLKKVVYDFDMSNIEKPDELSDFLPDGDWEKTMTELNETMAEMGQNPTVSPLIGEVQSAEVLKLFLEAGDDLSLASSTAQRAYIGLKDNGTAAASLNDYRHNKSPRYGNGNPERMTCPFWADMVRLGGNAYSARERYNDTDAFGESNPVWCYERFGSTLTQLADGRFVQIGGEHEDFYDPDFHIYNDVVVHDGKGQFEIYGYPKEVFPPTDFHSATLVGDWIYIIGRLGYVSERKTGQTMVHRLKLNSWVIEPVACSGQPPSWIHKHQADYDPERDLIRVQGGEIQVDDDNGDFDFAVSKTTFELNLSSLKWLQR